MINVLQGLSDPRAVIDAGSQTLAARGRRVWARHGALFSVLMLLGFMTAVFAIAFLRPVNNWDMIAYIGAALQDGSTSPGALHAQVWDIVRAGAAPEKFEALSTGDAYRLRQFTDSAAFTSQLGMYSVKWLYVEILKLVGPVTGYFAAPFAINLAAAGMITATLLAWLSALGLLRLMPLVLSFVVVAGFPAIAMSESPDLLAAGFVLVGVAALERRKDVVAGIAIVLSVLTRPDMVVLAGVLLAAAWYYRDRATLGIYVIFAGAFAAYSFVSHTGHHPGYWPHLWFSTYAMQDTMEGFHPAFSLKVYATAFAWNLARAAFENTWLGLYAAIGVGWLLTGARATVGSRGRWLAASLLLAIAAKFVLFPLHDGRTYFPLLFPAFMLLLFDLPLGALVERAAVPVARG